jgi:hypothetical protein
MSADMFHQISEHLRRAVTEFRTSNDALALASRQLVTAHEAVVAAHASVVDASQAQERAGEHMAHATEAIALSHAESRDKDETIARLETIVLDLQRRVTMLEGGAS